MKRTNNLYLSVDLPWRQVWNHRNSLLNGSNTLHVLTHSSQQSWVSSSSYYYYFPIATQKLRLRKVEWLTPGHTAVSATTEIPYAGLSQSPQILTLNILLALSVCEAVRVYLLWLKALSAALSGVGFGSHDSVSPK